LVTLKVAFARLVTAPMWLALRWSWERGDGPADPAASMRAAGDRRGAP